MITKDIEWIEVKGHWYRCSFCGTTIYVDDGDLLPTYCKCCEGVYPE